MPKFLVKVENIGHLWSLNVLDTPDIKSMLLSRLSGSVRDKWSRNVLTIHRRYKREPDLTDFIHFVNNVTIVTNPISSKQAVEQYMDRKPNSRRSKVT